MYRILFTGWTFFIFPFGFPINGFITLRETPALMPRARSRKIIGTISLISQSESSTFDFHSSAGTIRRRKVFSLGIFNTVLEQRRISCDLLGRSIRSLSWSSSSTQSAFRKEWRPKLSPVYSTSSSMDNLKYVTNMPGVAFDESGQCSKISGSWPRPE